MEAKIRFTKVREVKAPTRANEGDAGLDFYIPTNLTVQQLKQANLAAENITIGSLIGVGMVGCRTDHQGFITTLILGPHARVRIPSGIKVLIEPRESMLMAANKSGIAANKGLIFTSEIIDSPYTGEMNLCICNPGACSVHLNESFFDKQKQKALVQFIHVPIFDTTPEEISFKEFEDESKDWGTRGEKGFSSSDPQ